MSEKTLIKMQFYPEVAKDVGTDEAIIYSNIEFWCAKNKANGTNKHEGKYWTYNSIKAFKEQFNYLTEKQIRRCLDKLEKHGYINTGNYNKAPFDQTKWYSVNSILPNDQIDLTKRANGDDQTGKPIPDNKPNIKPNKKEDFSKNEYLSKDTNLRKQQFLDIWNEGRKKLLKVEHSNYNTIPAYNLKDFNTIANNYSIEDIKKAIKGLFQQKDCIPKLKSSPKHFLEVDNFETYLDAFNNKNFNLYKSKFIKENEL